METFEEWFKITYERDMYPHAWGPLQIPCLNAWDHQQQKINELVKCVEFYADKANWEALSTGNNPCISYKDIEFFERDYLDMGGKRARQCLEKHNGISTTIKDIDD